MIPGFPAKFEEIDPVTSINPPVRLAAASLAAVFALTACSSSEPSEGAGSAEDPVESGEDTESFEVFDFTGTLTEPAESIEFRVPEEVSQLDEKYSEGRVLDSVTITATEAEDPSQCAVEYQFNYIDGGLDRFREAAEVHYSDGSGNATGAAYYTLTGEPSGDYTIQEDFSSAVVPVKCAASPSDGEETADVNFLYVAADETIYRFFQAEVAVMQSGELFVHGTDLRSWQVDSNGNWLKG